MVDDRQDREQGQTDQGQHDAGRQEQLGTQVLAPIEHAVQPRPKAGVDQRGGQDANNRGGDEGARGRANQAGGEVD